MAKMEKECGKDSSELEDGEIDFDTGFDDIYTPLERPNCNDPVSTKQIIESDAEDNENLTSGESDSSDSEGFEPKKKKRALPSKPGAENLKKNKLKVWCNVLEGETVANILTDCTFDESQRRIRGLVPYIYRERNRNFNDFPLEKQNSFKRNHGGHCLGDRTHFKDVKTNLKKGASKNIPPLPDCEWVSNEDLAKEVANKLNEAKVEEIVKAIEAAGVEKIISIFEETRKIEKSGGLLIMNGSRRRTSGGVFFYLLKTSEEIPHEQLKQIFEKKRAGGKQKEQLIKETEIGTDDKDIKVS